VVKWKRNVISEPNAARRHEIHRQHGAARDRFKGFRNAGEAE